MTGQFFSSAGLDNRNWATLAEILERFERAWQADSCTNMARFVPAENGYLHLCVLFELIRVDQEYRWRVHEGKPLEAYLQQWPQLRHKPDIVAELLKSECLTRLFEDVPPTEEELLARFPHISKQIDLATLAAEVQEEGTNGGPTLGPSVHSTVANGGSTPLACGQRFGRYRIDEVLGSGSMGVVYRAHDPNLDRDVALKIPQWSDTRLADRFVREARLAAKIQHPNICPVFDVDQIDGVPYIAMALVDGPTLADLLKSRSFTPDETVELVRNVALALKSVHAQHIVHRDLKPSNIMLDGGGQLLLMDFGLARATAFDTRLETAGATAHCREVDASSHESLIGTPAYMSPEQVKRQPVDARSDIYSLGVLFYQLLTGKLPFQGSVDCVLRNILDSPPTKPRQVRPSVPEQLEFICLKAMAKVADDRYQRAEELEEVLDQYLHRADQTRWKTWLGVFAVLLLAAASMLLYFKTGSGMLALEVPPGAIVVVDGKSIRAGSGHLTIRLTVGRHYLKVTRTGASIGPIRIDVHWRGDRIRKVVSLPPSRIATGWHRDGYDLGRTYYYPFPSNRLTSNRLERVRWQPEKQRGPVGHVRTGDLDGDGTMEIVARIGDNVVAYDRMGKERWRRKPTADALWCTSHCGARVRSLSHFRRTWQVSLLKRSDVMICRRR